MAKESRTFSIFLIHRGHLNTKNEQTRKTIEYLRWKNIHRDSTIKEILTCELTIFAMLHFYGQDFIHICPAPLLLLNVIPVVNVHLLKRWNFIFKGLVFTIVWKFWNNVFSLQNFLNILTFLHVFFCVRAKFSLWERKKFLSHLIVFWKTVWTFSYPSWSERREKYQIWYNHANVSLSEKLFWRREGI